MKRAGVIVLGIVIAAAIVAPWLAPNDPNTRFPDLIYAPPTRVHFFGDSAALYINTPRLISRRERRFEEDRSRPVPIRFLAGGRLISADAAAGAPLLLLGGDGYGRDIFSRLLYGGRATLAVALIATFAAAWLGTLIGGVAGSASGWIDAALSRFSEFVLVLPTIYVALALRAVMPLVLSATQVFLLLTGIFTLLGWPIVARGVRAIVLAERERDYVIAARAAGAGPGRLLMRHLLPAANGYVLDAGIAAASRVHSRGGDDVVYRTRFSSGRGHVGNHASGRRRTWRCSAMRRGCSRPALPIFLVVLAVNIAVRQPALPR